MKKVKSLLIYLFTYILITFSTAFGVVLISNPAGASNNKVDVGNNNNNQVTTAPQINYIVENFAAIKAMELNLNAKINANGTSIKIGVNGIVDLSEGFEKIKAQGKLNVLIDATSFEINFSYLNNSIYLNLFNSNYKIDTTNIAETINQIMTLLNVEMPDLGMDLGSLDLDTILGMLSNLKENKTSTETTLIISLPVVGDMTVVCDLNYGIKSINLPKTTIDNISIELDAQINYPEKVEIIEPSDNFIEATDLFNIIEALIGTLKNNTIGLNVEISYNDAKLIGKLNADLQNYNASFNTTILGQNLNVVAIDNIIYFEYGNLKAKFGLDKISALNDIIKKQFGINIPISEIAGILQSIKNGNIKESLGNFDLSNLDLSKIDLSILENFEKVDNTYIITLKNIGKINLEILDHKINSIDFNGFGVSACLSFVDYDIVVLNGNDHIDLSLLLPTIDATLNTIKNNTFSGSLILNIQSYNLQLDYKITYDKNNFVAEFETIIANKNLKLTILNNNIYLEFSNLKIKANTNDIEEIVKLGINSLNVNLPEVTTNDIISIITNLTNPNTVPSLITKLEQFDGGIELQLFNELNAKIYNTTTINKIEIAYNKIIATININSGNFDVVPPIINESLFTDIKEFAKIANNLIDYINQAEFYFDIKLTYKNYVITGFINYNNSNFTALLETSIENRIIKIKIINNIIYAEIDGLNVSFNINDTDKLLTFIKDYLNIDVAYEISELIKETSNNLNILAIINELQFGYSNQILNINIKDINLNICFNNYELNKINILGNNFNCNIVKTNNLKQVILENNYFNIITALPFAQSLINTYNIGSFGGKITLTVNNVDYVVNYKISLFPTLQIYASTTILGTEIKLNYFNNTIYAQINNLLVSFNLNDIDYLKQFIAENFGDVINLNELDNLLSNIDLSSFNLKNIQNLFATNNMFNINIMGINIGATFDNNLKTLNILYKNLALSIELNSFGSNVKMPIINTNRFDDCKYLLNAVKNVYDIVKTKDICITGNLNINSFSVPITAIINYEQGLTAKITTIILNKTLEIYLINNVIYINFDGLKLQYSLNDLPKLLKALEDNFDFNINEVLENNIDIANSLSVLNISKTNKNSNYSLVCNLLFNNQFIDITLDFNKLDELTNLNININNLDLNLQLLNNTEPIILDSTGYNTNVNDLVELITPISNLINTMQFELTGKIGINLFNEMQTLNIKSLKVKVINKNIDIYALIDFNGISASVSIYNNIVYLNALGLKVKLPLNDIDGLINWINKTFNQQISLDNIDTQEILDSIYFGIIKEICKTPMGLLIKIDNNSLAIDFDNYFKRIYGNIANINIDLNFVAFNNVEIDKVVDAEYESYNTLLSFVDSAINYLQTKQYNLNANAVVYNNDVVRFNANANLQIDMQNSINVYGAIALTGDQNINLTANIYNNYFFVNYNDLKLKINVNDLNEILVVVLNLIGIDPSILPFLTDAMNGVDLNLDNLQNIIPSISFDNPLGMLKIIKRISFDNNNLSIILDGTLISPNPNAKEMVIQIGSNGSQLTHISINNLYTGVTENEYFNLDINFDKFDGVKNPDESQNYIDISNSNELIKALINTAELDNYEIDGSLKINGNLIGININWNVPFNFKIQLDENKMPIIMAVVGEIPTLIGVDNDVPYEFGDTESGSGRMLYIYYKDGYVYFYRTEYVDIMFGASKRLYEKKLKAPLEDVLSDPLKYLQYGIGFTNTIMDAIRASINNSSGHTPNLGNIIKSFTATDAKNFNVVLNMQELTNDNKMDTMSIGIKVVNNESTKNKNYIGGATFNMYMPLADAFKLTLNSDNITLKDIGKVLDFTKLFNYVNSYTYNEGAEWEASNGSWKKASEKTYTIRFEENGGANVNDITQAANTTISLPSYSNRNVDDTANHTQYTYRFDGWFTTSTFNENTLYTSTIMPRSNMTLYAKWTLIKTIVTNYYTVTFVTNSSYQTYSNISVAENSKIAMGNYVPHKCDTHSSSNVGTKCNHTTFTFEGWYLDSNLTIKFNGSMPSNNITLYAKYTTSTWNHGTAFGVCNKDCH